MIIGRSDVGKSGLALFLANKSLEAGCRPAIVDSDIGQSDVGPPGTIGLALLRSQAPLYGELELADAYFVGDKSAAGHLLPMVVGTMLMVDRAKEEGASPIIVNTTGLVGGGVGWALKHYKVEAVRPDLLIAVEEGDELAHIIDSLNAPWAEVKRVRPPEAAARKDYRDRARYRTVTLEPYLRGAEEVRLNLSSVKRINARVFSMPRSGELESRLAEALGGELMVGVDGEEVVAVLEMGLGQEAIRAASTVLRAASPNFRVIALERLKGLYLGFYSRDGRFAGVGRLLDLDVRSMVLSAAAKLRVRADDVGAVAFGYLILDEAGREVGGLRPGYL